MGLFATQCKGNHGTLEVLSMGALEKCKDILREAKEDVMEGLIVFLEEVEGLRVWDPRFFHIKVDIKQVDAPSSMMYR